MVELTEFHGLVTASDASQAGFGAWNNTNVWPVGQIGGRRAVRGASFSGSEVNLRTRWRDSHVVTNAVAFVGFRCAHGF